jgi:hypothetical protein
MHGPDGRFISNKKSPTLTKVGFVVDESGSIVTYGLANGVKTTVNNWLDKIRNEDKIKKQNSFVTLSNFSDNSRLIFSNVPSSNLNKFVDYRPRDGMTALFTATREMIEELEKQDDGRCSFLLLVITDGNENRSFSKDTNRISNIITGKLRTGRWTIAFLLPRGYGSQLSSRYGINSENIQEWETTKEGLKNADVNTNDALDNYYTSRSIGKAAVASFFVKTDLSKLTTSKIAKSLDDISSSCKIYELQKEADIKPFVESKTGKPYVVGSTFYQLVKKEKVSYKKEVLVNKKGEPEIWSGSKARQLIGLPENADAKVEPYNHSCYDIYVQSHSNNRILPRGSKIIVRS